MHLLCTGNWHSVKGGRTIATSTPPSRCSRWLSAVFGGRTCQVCAHSPCLPCRCRESPWLRRAGRSQELGGELELGSLRRWLGAQSEAGMARATLARRAATARSFTGWALREELIQTDPAVRLQAPKRDKSLPGVLQQQQVSRMVDDLNSAAADGDAWLCATGPWWNSCMRRESALGN